MYSDQQQQYRGGGIQILRHRASESTKASQRFSTQMGRDSIRRGQGWRIRAWQQHPEYVETMAGGTKLGHG